MMNTIHDSWSLTKSAFRMIKEDKALLAFPAVAAVSAIGVLALVFVASFYLFLYTTIPANTAFTIILILWVALYFILWFIGTFFTAALIAAATMKIEGKQPTLSDGLNAASAHWKKLLLWAIFAGTVGLIIQMITSRIRGLPGMIIGIAATAAWGVMTYFILPVLLYENLSTWQSLKRSAGLFIHNFGRTIVSNIMLGVILFLAFLGVIALGGVGLYFLFYTSTPIALGVLLVLAAVVVGIFVALIASASESILVAALYRYASTGKMDPNLVHPKYQAVTPTPVPSSGPLPSSSTSYM